MLTLSLLLAMGAQAPTAAPAPAAPATMTRQQAFDAASKLAEEGKCAEAVAAFEALEARLTGKGGELVKAAVAVRKGKCLAALGQDEDGEASMRAGIEMLAGGGESFAGEVYETRVFLGGLAARRLDYAPAKADLLLALQSATTDAQRLVAYSRLVTVTMFDPGPEPLDYANKAVALAASLPGKEGRLAVAAARSSLGRVLMNRGQGEAAYAELKEALRLQGGLDTRVSLSEIDTRFDLATAASLTGRTKMIMDYISYTGSGWQEDAPFATSRTMEVPPCGAVDGLTRDSVTVVSFVIGGDGTVTTAVPVYSNGGREVALTFAKAVKQWSWSPEATAKIPAFFRTGTRVELRCTLAGANAPGVWSVIEQPYLAWRAQQGVSDPGVDGAALPSVATLKQRLAAAQSSGNSSLLLSALLDLVMSQEASSKDVRAFAALGEGLPERAGLPNAVRLYADYLFATSSVRTQAARRDALLPLLDKAYLANEPQLINALRIMFARPWFQAWPLARADALLEAVVNDKRLDDKDPLRVAAHVEMANSAARKGDVAAAARYFAATGLTGEQCSLLGLKPDFKRGYTSDDYPAQMLSYGMEGWTRLEFDVEADGRAAMSRSVITFPPFTLSRYANDLTKGLRFQSSFRPEGGTACTANSHTVRFVMPRS